MLIEVLNQAHQVNWPSQVLASHLHGVVRVLTYLVGCTKLQHRYRIYADYRDNNQVELQDEDGEVLLSGEVVRNLQMLLLT